jgi:hypothetical protein
MTTFQQYMARAAIGSGLVAIGIQDFKNARLPQGEGSVDELILRGVSEETATNLRRATATLLIIVGAFICVSALVTEY